LRKPQRWLFLFCLSFLPCSARASGVAPAWALLAEARVVGDSIYLSDLLPAQTPLELRDAAGKILLAAAPPPGSSLTLAGERIRGVLPAAARERLAVPPQVLIHRSGRLLTHAEVLAALRTAWQSNQLPGASGREPEDVHFSAPVQVSAIDARLEVRRIDFDPALNQARFLLASSADRRSLPFLVTADLGPASRQSAAASGLENVAALRNSLAENRTGPAAAEFYPAATALVEPKRAARLHVVSASMQMFLDVLPLEKGVLYQTVRVRLAGGGKVLRGQVIAPGLLEAQF